MARKIEVIVKGDTKQLDKDIKDAADAGGRNMRQLKSAIDSTNASFKSLRSEINQVKSAIGTLGIATALKEVAQTAIQSAIAIDRQVNSLKALTGSAEAATKRFQELFRLAQQTPGLTTSLAATLDAQLRVFKVSEQTINQLLPTIGKLNAISPLGDPRQFVNNLTQLITQNFERQDLKELVGQSPIAGQLIAQIFNVDNPTNADAIRKSAKKLGVTTVERLAEELVRAGENNSALRNATESIGGQFEKLQDRITVSLAPIGSELLKTILPAAEKFVDLLEQDGPKIAEILRNQSDEIARSAKSMLALVGATFKLVSVLDVIDQKTGVLNKLSLVIDPIARLLDGFDRLKKDILKLDPNNRVFPLGSGPAVIVGDRSGLPKNADSLLFPGGGGGSPVFVNNRGIVRDAKGKIINRIDMSRPGDGDGAGAAARRARQAARDRVQDYLIEASNERFKGFLYSADRDMDVVADYYKKLAIRTEEINKAINNTASAAGSMVSRGFSNLIRTGVREFNDANRDSSRSYNLQLQNIDELLNRGALNPDQAEALRRQAALGRASALNSNLNGPNAKFQDPDKIRNLRDEAEYMARLGTAISNTERFMRGFNSAIISVGDAFDRFGQNVAQALTNTKDLLNGLKNAVLGFFNDLLGRSLENLVGQALAPIAGLFGGGGGLALAGGGGRASVPINIGQIFQTATASGLSAPSSVSLGPFGFGQGFGIQTSFGGGGSAAGVHEALHASVAGSTASKFSFGALGKSFAAAAPFLGFSIGSGLGGQSLGGNILGGIGGALGGLVAGTALAGGTLGSLGSTFALTGALGPAALVAAPLLIAGGILLGKAKQRRQDEELSGQYLTQALQAIDQLAAGVQSGQIDGTQAKAVFENQILAQFRQQISGLKTKSVVESRLKNQVADLRKVYEARIPPLIAEQEKRAADARRFAAIDSRLVPQFAGGGYVGGVDRGFDSVKALLRPGELVLNRAQQAAVIAQSNRSVFQNAGVPSMNTSGRFDSGGYAQPASYGARSDSPVIIYLDAVVDAEGIFIRGGSTESGRQVIVKQIDRTNLKKSR